MNDPAHVLGTLVALAATSPLLDAPVRPQPAPSGGTGDVWAEVLDRLGSWDLETVRGLCAERRLEGIALYGVPLGRGDGRDEVRDLREELLDAAVYAARLGGKQNWALCRMLLEEVVPLVR